MQSLPFSCSSVVILPPRVRVKLEQIVASKIGVLTFKCEKLSKMTENGFSGTAMRQLLRRAKTATLSTLGRDDGTPYGSLANIATDVAGKPIILISRLAWHTRNLLADPRASILVGEIPETGDALVGPRVTVLGRFVQDTDENLRRRYLAQHPQASMYADFSDFSFWRMEPKVIHGVAGFGRIETLPPEDVFPNADEMTALEISAIQHMNHDHVDAIQRYAIKLLAAEAGEWRVQAIDPDGFHLGWDEKSLRLQFDVPVYNASDLRQKLAELARDAEV
jgi:heme iron utilization protein